MTTRVRRAALLVGMSVLAGAIVAPWNGAPTPTAAAAGRAFGRDVARERIVSSLELATAGHAVVSRRPGSEFVTFVGGSPRRPLSPPTQDDPSDAARAFVDSVAPAFGVEDREDALVQDRTSEGADGTVAIRYQQTYDDVPVLAGELAVAVGDDGAVLSVAGEASDASGIDTTPMVPAAAASAVALDVAVRADGVDASLLTASEPERWVYDPELLGAPDDAAARLVWRVEVRTEMGDVDRLVLVDAATAEVALTFSQRHDAKSIALCDKANVRSNSLSCGGTFPITSEGFATALAGDVEIAWKLSSATYDFYRNTFGRRSVNNPPNPADELELRSTVRFCPPSGSGSCPYPNAFWNGSQMVYGEGYASADDVVAHELTHGVTQFEADLFYYGESGAINESLSDVFGELFDLAYSAEAPSERWKLGEGLPGAANGIRNMADPTQPPFRDPDRMTSPMFSGDPDDHHGVHVNSGVNNKAAFLMTDGGSFNGQTIRGLGSSKVGWIYYEALTTLLGPGSDYADLAVILPQACRNLMATVPAVTDASDCAEVDEVVLATEMHLRPTSPGATLTAPACDGGSPTSTLFADDMENPGAGKWIFESANAGKRPEWAHHTGSSQSGLRSLHGADVATPTDSWARTSGRVSVTAETFLRFDHSFSFEYDDSSSTYYDGGVVEYTTDLVQWNDVATLGGAVNGYRGHIYTAPSSVPSGDRSALEGRRAFAGTSPSYQQTRIDLSSLAGSRIHLRFRTSTDAGGAADGWFIDDVAVYTCGPVSPHAPAPAPAAPAPAPAAPAPAPTAPAASAHAFVASGPVRLLDTRVGESPAAMRNVPKGRIGGEYVLEVQVTDLPGVVPRTGVGAVALNVAVTDSAGAGFVSVYPCGPRPFVSSVNHVRGETVSNAVIAPVSASGTVCIYSLVAAHVVVDLNGWFPAGAGHHAVGPARVFDTRPGESPNALRAVDKTPLGAGHVLEVRMSDLGGFVPATGVGAVSLNVAVTGSSRAGFVSAYPCGERPVVATVNHGAGETVGNAVIAPVSPTGTVCFFSLVAADLVVDVNGWFATGSGYTATRPQRVLDTRPGESPAALRSVPKSQVGGDDVLEVRVTDLAGSVPASGVTAVSLNVAVTGSAEAGFVTVFPCGARPFTATVNHAPGDTVSNAVIAPVSAAGTICLYSLVRADLVVDINGWFAA